MKAPVLVSRLAKLASLALFPSAALAAAIEMPLRNPDFTEGVGTNGVPAGWSLYGGRGKNQRVSVVDDGDGARAALIEDDDPENEVGITQIVPVEAGVGYEARVRVRARRNASPAGAHIQLRFLPSNEIAQEDLTAKSPDEFTEIAVCAMAPPGTKSAQIYLYTHRGPTPQVLVAGVRLLAGVQPPAAVPAPVPPQYTKLKDLHLATHFVQGGKPAIRIVVPRSGIHAVQAARLQAAVRKLTGCTVPIVSDDAPEAVVPITGNLILLGNRSTNAAMAELYNRFFLLTDLRYPGPGGYELRTLHNPFGGGHNAIVAGGSDAQGVDAAASALIEKLATAGGTKGALSIGWTLEIKAGSGVAVPRGVREMETWEASSGYRSTGYFGWNSISKRMAAYYMSGDPFHAREALRLAFPDKQAFKEISDIDGEMIENKDDPLAGPYHYNAHMLILFWDLIEESPVFSDQERLKVTNAFARQLAHRRDEGVYRLTRPPGAVGSRHGQWSAISLYCLGRYFQRDYPDPVWDQCVRGARFHFAPLETQAWINGESDNLFWYCTGIAPVFSYMLLSGERAPMRNGVAATLLRGQELLVSGRVPDWALRSAALDYLHKAAYLTHDGRWLAYRDRTGVDTAGFRLGQSFWPDEALKPAPPADLAGKWTVNPMPEPHWRARNSGLPPAESFYNASVRTAPDAGGDFILVDGFNGASRNPYHAFAILELRIAGRTILQGYLNQVLAEADGMVEPKVPMDAALRRADVVGQTALCVGEVPGAAFCNWRRTLAQRTGRYALVVDDLTFRTDSDNMEVQIKWENSERPFRFDAGRNALLQDGSALVGADLFHGTARSTVVTQEWTGAARKGRHKIFFTLLGPEPAPAGSLQCLRLADNAAALALPRPAVAIVGERDSCAADLLVLAEDHLFAIGLKRSGFDHELLSASAPVDIDWDFETGRMEVVARGAAILSTSVTDPPAVRSTNATVKSDGKPGGHITISLREGRSVIEGIQPSDVARHELPARLAAWSDQAAAERSRRDEPSPLRPPAAPSMAGVFSAQVGGAVNDMIVISSDGPETIAVAETAAVHLIDAEGRELRQMRADGRIRQLHWWPEHALLLAGCEDEKVCAFDLAGNRKWTFVSEMDPAVFRAAKQYWFKSAPRHGGIHGLDSGVFLDGRSQAFIGSACTLEIVDENGKLLRRLPQFWGTVHKFAIVPGPEGSLNLLASRKITDGPSLAIINSGTLDPSPRGFQGVPGGHTLVGGWMDQTRHHLFVEDMDGDGSREVSGEITGAWNRVTVWDLQGKALHNAQFGPGDKGPGDIRDIAIGDLDGGGTREFVVALSNGLVVALNHRCEKIWAARLGSPPLSLTLAGHSTIAGCEDGTVVALDSRGGLTGQGRVGGRPLHVLQLKRPPLVVFATDKGAVTAFRANR